MNKKGFAVSVILYSIILLIVTTLLVLLGVIKTRYSVNEKLRENVIEEMNGEIDIGVVFPSSGKCTINANSSDYTDNLVLTIVMNDNNVCMNDGVNVCQYSWDNETYTNSNSVNVNHAGKYTGYFKDRSLGMGNCEGNIVSKVRYSHRDCHGSNILYGEWYLDSETYNNTCSEVSKATAETNYSGEYTICNTGSGSACGSLSPCYRVQNYKRNPIGCSNWEIETWSGWSDNAVDANAIRQIRTATTYKLQ